MEMGDHKKDHGYQLVVSHICWQCIFLNVFKFTKIQLHTHGFLPKKFIKIEIQYLQCMLKKPEEFL